ncbi:hypothetical protein BDE27_3739 [Xenorhabdus ehlersii]|uniref:Uncharacterized protein n=1 Tax=Xenorhabdus ehlersii TaxID=290111 RepID=A0A2D0IZ99_9GAMM|nr:hypothetical protein Xehl_00284 [Xenorhabdus ehlersii]RKE87397.1 hypothetical protein BDE27_3739 [Xenorhabdus ehlersii]
MMSKTVILSVLIVFSMSVTYANWGKTGCEIKKKRWKNSSSMLKQMKIIV